MRRSGRIALSADAIGISVNPRIARADLQRDPCRSRVGSLSRSPGLPSRTQTKDTENGCQEEGDEEEGHEEEGDQEEGRQEGDREEDRDQVDSSSLIAIGSLFTEGALLFTEERCSSPRSAALG
jgi:hypothetical protein